MHDIYTIISMSAIALSIELSVVFYFIKVANKK